VEQYGKGREIIKRQKSGRLRGCDCKMGTAATRTSTKKKVIADFWEGRLKSAKAFRKAAEEGLALAEPSVECHGK
jgi:hypothetical protein